MARSRSAGRYANVTSTLALMVALGGTGAYAASTIGSKDIRNGQVKQADLARGAVTSAKVKNGSLRRKDFHGGVAGPTGATGAGGPPGPAGAEGPAGPPLPDTLPSGKTLKGAYAFSGVNDNGNADGDISFQIPLASPPAVVVVRARKTSTTCTGSVAAPTAPGGVLCVYESDISDNDGLTSFSPQTGEHDVATPYGVGLFIVHRGDPNGTSLNKTSKGSWAVTAP